VIAFIFIDSVVGLARPYAVPESYFFTITLAGRTVAEISDLIDLIDIIIELFGADSGNNYGFGFLFHSFTPFIFAP
jgi:hypothetical protein